MPMLEGRSRSELDTTEISSHELRQRRQMLIALALLLVALIMVVVKDRQFWFPSQPTAQSDALDQDTTATDGRPQAVNKASAAPLPVRKKTKERAAVSVVDATATQAAPPAVINRTTLPPLEVEVVAGNERRTIRSNNSSLKVDMQRGTTASPGAPLAQEAGSTAAGTSAATERVRLSPQTAQVVSRPVQPNYPLLAKQMKVQGSVVLQALIGKDGHIQDLQLISGPAILASAAQEAVKQWRFKPYYQAGEPVETEARITVNFTISAN